MLPSKGNMSRYSTHTLREKDAVKVLAEKSRPLTNTNDLDPLMERISNARIVMLGEASHGTHEYYTCRAQITKRLIKEKGFNFIAVEGDWPDCYELNRYIKNYVQDKKAVDVLKSFDRWPTWMWANWEIVALSEWLCSYNKELEADKKVGFYGLDVYSLWDSMEAIKGYLEKVDPSAFKVAQKAFECFDPYKKDDGTSYALATQMVPDLCRSEVVKLLQEIQNKMPMQRNIIGQ